MRYLLLILLVFVFPGAVYWAVNGMATPGDTLDRFTGQLSDIHRSQPEPVEEDVLGPPPKAESEPEPKAEPDQPETDSGGAKVDPQPEIKKPVVPRREADALFVEGRFDEAAAAYGNTRSRRRALAKDSDGTHCLKNFTASVRSGRTELFPRLTAATSRL